MEQDVPSSPGEGRPVWLQDQAAGLRRLFKARPSPAIAFVSAVPGIGTTRALARVGLALSAMRHRVLLVDEHGLDVFGALGTGFRFDLYKALNGNVSLEQVLVSVNDHLKLLPAARSVPLLANDEVEGRRKLASVLGPTWRAQSLILMDARVSENGHPLSVLCRAASHVIVVVAGGAATTASYVLIRRLAAAMPTVRLHVLVSKVRGDEEAVAAFSSLADVAYQHLGVRLNWLGWVPMDPSWRDGVVLSMISGAADSACENLAHSLKQLAGLGEQGEDSSGSAVMDGMFSLPAIDSDLGMALDI